MSVQPPKSYSTYTVTRSAYSNTPKTTALKWRPYRLLMIREKPEATIEKYRVKCSRFTESLNN